MYLFHRFEDPNQPLLGPNVYWLKFWGLILPKNIYFQYVYKFIQISVLLFGVTEFIELWYVRTDFKDLLNNLKITMTSVVSLSKIVSFMVNQKAWCEVINSCNRTEIRERTIADSYPESKRIIEKYTAYCRRLTYSYWVLVLITCSILIFQPIMRYVLSQTYREDVKNGVVPYDQIFSAWVPFDKNTVLGYTFVYLYHAFVAVYAGGLLMSFDTISIVLMVFFKGQIELLQCRCERIFGNVSTISDDEAMESLKECHRINVDLHKYAKLFDSLLSPIMLLYMFVCSVMLCCSTFQLITEVSTTQRFLIAEYLVFGIAQLFIYCWHSNDVFYKSQDLFRSPYKSLWYTRKTTLSKELVLLTGQMSKTIVFTAGPFTDLTVATFISILKGAYSYYTLLSKRN